MRNPAPGDVTLAFDTSGPACCGAILSGETVVADRVEQMARGQAERLIPLLDELLEGAGLVWRDVALIGVGVGPGNFTGIRISVAAARGLAVSLGCRAIGVSTLDALALDQPRPCLTVVPARHDTVCFRLHDDGPPQEPRSLSLADGITGAVPCGVPICGDGADRIAAMNGGRILAPAAPRAVAIARLARAVACAGHDTERPRPLYLRAADAVPARDHPPRMLAP